jgi:hypothetical protein
MSIEPLAYYLLIAWGVVGNAGFIWALLMWKRSLKSWRGTLDKWGECLDELVRKDAELMKLESENTRLRIGTEP